MKRKKMSHKLVLNKITVTSLNSNDLANRKAGALPLTWAALCTAYCNTDETYCPTQTGAEFCTRDSQCQSVTI